MCHLFSSQILQARLEMSLWCCTALHYSWSTDVWCRWPTERPSTADWLIERMIGHSLIACGVSGCCSSSGFMEIRRCIIACRSCRVLLTWIALNDLPKCHYPPQSQFIATPKVDGTAGDNGWFGAIHPTVSYVGVRRVYSNNMNLNDMSIVVIAICDHNLYKYFSVP